MSLKWHQTPRGWEAGDRFLIERDEYRLGSGLRIKWWFRDLHAPGPAKRIAFSKLFEAKGQAERIVLIEEDVS